MINLKTLIENEDEKEIKQSEDLQTNILTYTRAEVQYIGDELTIRCPNCGFLNGMDRIVCARCKTALGTLKMDK